MIPSLTLNALSSGLGHFGVALHGNHIRHIDTYGSVVDNSKTKITCFVRSSESVDVLNILKKSPNISYYVGMITHEAYNFKGEFKELSNLDSDALNISENYRKNLKINSLALIRMLYNNMLLINVLIYYFFNFIEWLSK